MARQRNRQTAAAQLTPEEKRARRKARQNEINPVTGLTKRGMVGVQPTEAIRPQVETDVGKALEVGGKFGGLIGPFEKVSTESSGRMNEYLARNRQLADDAYKFSGREEKSLGEMEKGLEGYNSQEVQAMRESANAEMDRNLKTAQYQQAIQQARAGVSGGAALAGSQDLALQALEGKRATERDLVVQNAQEALARKQAFANTVQGMEAARWGRTGAMEGQYGTFMSSEEAARRQAEQFNATQGTNEQLARAGLTLEGAGIYTGGINTAEANRLAALGYNAQNVLNRQALRYANKQSSAMLQNNLAVAGINADAAITAAGIQAEAAKNMYKTAPMQSGGALPPIGGGAGGQARTGDVSTGSVYPQDTTQTQRVGSFNTNMQRPGISRMAPSDSSMANRSMGFKQTASSQPYGKEREEERRMY